MKVVIAPDSFKESLTAVQAAQAMARGVRAVVPQAQVVQVPMSDGGEGFTDAVAAAMGAQVRQVETIDARGRPVTARMSLTAGTAVMEMAGAAGLELIAPGDRRVRRSDTRGVGRMVRAALDAGARHLLLGIGGSATNDGGAGMLAELGVRFLDAAGRPLGTVPDDLAHLARVDVTGLDPRLGATEIEVACDVDNPLVGPHGASAVFGPQKGADRDDVAFLDGVLTALARASGYQDLADRPGAGAAGGLGFALTAFLGASLQPGVELVARAVGLAEAVAGADLVLTREGSVDAQTLAGKTPAGVARVAAAQGVPTVVLAGRVGDDADVLLSTGCVAIISTSQGEALSLPEILRAAARTTERAAATALRLWTHQSGPVSAPPGRRGRLSG